MNWECSGQGGGGVDTSETKNDDGSNATAKIVFGSFANWMDCAHDLHKSFVSFNQTYLLYFWHMLEKHDLIKTLMQQLDYAVLAPNGATDVSSIINIKSDNEAFSVTKKEKFSTMETKLQQLSWSIQSDSASIERSELCRLIEALRH